MDHLVFKRWSNKKYAVFNSLRRIIHIGSLSLTYTMLQPQPALSQSDTITPMSFYDLEEVEKIAETDAVLYSPLLRQLLQIQQDRLQFVASRSIDGLLDHYPGIDIRTRGVNGIQSDLTIQGGSFEQSMVMLNGINMNNPQTGHFNLDLPVNLSQIQEIEVLKGPGARIYGLNSYSGALNIITSPKDSLSFTADATYGNFNTYSLGSILNLPVGRTKNMLSSSFAGSDGYRENTDFLNSNLYLHSTIDSRLFRTNLMLGWNMKNFGANSFYTPLYPEQYEETSSWFTALKITSKGNYPGITADIYWKRHTDHFLLFRNNPTAYENHHLTDVIGSSVGRKISSRFGITSIEFKFRHEEIYSTSLGEISSRQKQIKNSGTGYYNRFGQRDHFSLSLYQLVQYNKIYFNGGTLFNAGINELTGPGIYPGIDISYLAGDRLRLFGSVNRSMRLPTFTDLYYIGPQNLGNPDLKPEKAITYETGIKYEKRSVRVDIGLFYRVGSETIDWIWEEDIWQSRNLTELRTKGIETSVIVVPDGGMNFLKRLAHLRLSYSFSETDRENKSIISNYLLDNLKHKLTGDVTIELPFQTYLDMKVSFQAREGYYQYYESPHSDPVETPYQPFWLADLSAGKKVGKAELSIDVTNLMNVHYHDIGNVIMPGRWMKAVLKYRM